jgi:Ribbon-helix-helix protein, copG family
MRTTVNLDDDVAAAVEELRRERGVGLSQAVNELARTGLRRPAQRRRAITFTPHALGIKTDVSNVAEVLERLDAEDGQDRPR